MPIDNNKMEKIAVPEHVEGKQNDLFGERTFDTEEDAVAAFACVRGRLLRPSSWEKIADTATVSFQPTDSAGQPIERDLREQDHLRIDLAGPGPSAGKGYDWVRVDPLLDNPDHFTLTLMACPAPTGDAPDAAHFFAEGASSSFVLIREGKKILLSYHGRNEKPNIHTDSALDNIRNAATAAAAMLGFSEMQWSALLNGLLTAYS